MHCTLDGDYCEVRKNLWSHIQGSDFSGAVGFKESVSGIVLEAVSKKRG
jgi:hypothetical protein